jgi:phage gp45-like
VTLRASAAEAARRVFLAITRGTVVKADDAHKMQELEIRGIAGERWQGVEHWQPAGFRHVPMPPDENGEAEALVALINGSRSHPVVVAVADRRSGSVTGLDEGDICFYDPRNPLRRVHFTKTGGLKIQAEDGTVVNVKLGQTQVTAPDGLTTVLVRNGRVDLGRATGTQAVRLADGSLSLYVFAA